MICASIIAKVVRDRVMQAFRSGSLRVLDP